MISKLFKTIFQSHFRKLYIVSAIGRDQRVVDYLHDGALRQIECRRDGALAKFPSGIDGGDGAAHAEAQMEVDRL